MTLNGSFDPRNRVVFDSGITRARSTFVYGLGAVGPALTTMTALQNSGFSIFGAVQSGNLLEAAGALQAPGMMTGFLFAKQRIAVDTGAIESGLRVGGYQRSGRGLLAPLQPVTVTLTPTSGMRLPFSDRRAVWRPSSRPTQRFQHLTGDVCGPPQTA